MYLSNKKIWNMVSVFWMGCLAFFLFILCISCSSVHYPAKPITVYKKYHDAMSRGDIQNAVSYISERDRSSFEQSFMEHPSLVEFNMNLYQRVEWKVNDVQLSDNSALLHVTFHMPNYGALMGEEAAALISGEVEASDERDPIEFAYLNATKKLKQNDFEYRENKNTLQLVKENGKWKILLDLEKKDKILEMTSQALHLFTSGQYDSAKELFEKILSFNPDNIIAKQYLKKINSRLNEERK